MVLREFKPTDIPRAISLWQHIEHIWQDEADSSKNLKKFLARNPGLSFVAVENESLLGTILCGQDGRRGYIYHLAVDPMVRRHGIGKQLVNHSLGALRAEEILKCHFHILRDNEFGEFFWQPEGWRLRTDLHIYSKNL